jgi:hypothetical protein
MVSLSYPKTGLPSLDKVINNLRLGDNVVWQVDSIYEYKTFVDAFVKETLKENLKLVYIRFAKHKPLVRKVPGVTIYELDASVGFETFSTELNNIITREGKGMYYVFDSLSDLLSAWATDLMIGNFFMVTCPYLFELDTIAYFALIRNKHSFKTIARIRETTQLLLDIYLFESVIYLHPLKVWKRYSPTMFMPHISNNEEFTPIVNSVEAAKLFSYISNQSLEMTNRNMDYWDRLFIQVEERMKKKYPAEKNRVMIEHICSIMIGKEERIIELFKKYFSLEDLLYIKTKLIGTGFIGGKAVGMLLARNILTKDKSFKWSGVLEPHDSFYIGSDVFYSYIVQNSWWRLRLEQKTKDGYFKIAEILKNNLLKGEFPDEIKEQFIQMLEYFGQSPIIVRSSSLLEDSFGNAFAGKYESYFLVNQGTPEIRYEQFIDAVRKIYASTMNEDALAYRMQRGLEFHDEQMALLVQRVSGSYHKKYFFPDTAGVGISYNTFIWKKNMDPAAGVLRLVFGLGTRAVNRVDNDYPRTVALDMPLTKPNAGLEDDSMYAQKEVDILNIPGNTIETIPFNDLMKEEPDLRLDKLAVRDRETTRRMREAGSLDEAWMINFDELLSKTDFPGIMQNMMKTIEKSYHYPVDIEFTANFDNEDRFHINLLQCRPLQTRGNMKSVHMPGELKPGQILFQSEGNFIGGSISQKIKRLIYIDPKRYGDLPLTSKYEVARLIGKLNRQITDKVKMPVVLLGPGRWGTSTPNLGVPVSFSEINNISIIGEMAYPIAGLIPELSFGTHFFQDLIETGIFYISLFPDKHEEDFNIKMIEHMPNHFEDYLPEQSRFSEIIRVYDFTQKEPLLMADLLSQRMVCFFNE